MQFIDAAACTADRPWGALGRVCVAEEGDEHVAHPAPQARVLVVERAGSIEPADT